ncbi:DUF4437 domain-containing protein [Seonamhaeicola sp.]|uniref:DUF4437 domain-containing protein n=1 Tax=Seonamhaeicola sp. TaxID=1912245 RepID=UPI002616C4C8|nr:DUF4437 domain-containing protein [Seonamhaeicola sp.]
MKPLIFKIIIIAGLCFLTACQKGNKERDLTKGPSVNNTIPDSIHNSSVKIVLASEVDWTYLNPKRKDKAPMAGTLWGDRTASGPTGFLLKPKDSFSSPPHIHNVSYRGLVISGLIHNDDPNAENMWMPSGSFWTQPKGHVHITSAKGVNTMAYIEIEEGPYLVLPKEDAFDSGERPVNQDKSNMVWLDASEISWSEVNGSQMAFLWKEHQLHGTLLKLPEGFKGHLYTKASTFGAVVIKGQPKYAGEETTILETGSFFSSKGEVLHRISTKNETILYIRTSDKYKVILNK